MVGMHVGFQYPRDLPAIARYLFDQHIGVRGMGPARCSVEIQNGIDNRHGIRGRILNNMTGRIRGLIKVCVNLRDG